MKHNKFLTLLLTFAILVSGMTCVISTVHAGELGYTEHKLIGLDKVEAVTIPIGTTITSKDIPQVSVTEEYSDDYNTVSGVLYKLIVPEDDMVYLTFETEEQRAMIYQIYKLGNPTIISSGDTVLKGDSCLYDSGTYYFWVTGDNGTLSITTESLIEKTAKKTSNKNKVYVYTYNSEVAGLMEIFYEKYPQYKDKVICVNLEMEGTSNEYITCIKKLAWNSKNSTSIVAMDVSIVDDMFATQKFVSLKSLGLEDDYESAYDFTKKQGSYNGTQYLATWQACSGGFIYDSAIAKEVLGTSDPVKVQEMINTPEKFLEVAAKMKAAGYYMVTGLDNLYSWVNDNEEEVSFSVHGFQSSFRNVNDQTCRALACSLASNDYATKNNAWSTAWDEDLKDMRGRKVFGVFGCTWFDRYSVPKDSALYKYGQCCPGPLTYSWGGTYLGVTNQNKNQELAALVLQTLCCDDAVMTKICENEGHFVNNKNVNLSLAADSKAYSKQTSGSYNGQNLYDAWNQMALAIGNKTSISLEKPLKKGTSVTVGSVTYKINNLSKHTVTYVNTKKKAKTVNIPGTVTIRDVKYNVTEIGTGAFKGDKKMTKLNVGKNVEVIGKDAFKNCTGLKTANINSTVLTKIGANAFSGDKKLNKITLKTKELTKNSVGKNALKGTSAKLVIKVPSKKVTAYKKYFMNKGNKSVKVKK